MCLGLLVGVQTCTRPLPAPRWELNLTIPEEFHSISRNNTRIHLVIMMKRIETVVRNKKAQDFNPNFNTCWLCDVDQVNEKYGIYIIILTLTF